MASTSKPAPTEAWRDRQGKLGALFDKERAFSRTGVPIVVLDYGGGGGGESERRRVRVEESCNESGGGVVEEKWRFQAEMLRAECNLLRMEREIAVKKLERSRVKMEKTLRSAVQTLVSVSLSLSFSFSVLFLYSFVCSVFLLKKCRKRKEKNNRNFQLSCLELEKANLK